MGAQETAFWTAAWRAADRQRIAQYAAQLDPDADRIIDCLRAHGAKTVCDAGCGCGAYARKLALHGFAVSGFDLSADAAALAQGLLAEAGCPAGAFLAADILHTPYPDASFDAVVARDVLDHMPRADAARAVRELLRITRPGGCVLLTLDETDGEYESEAHTVNADGDYLFTDGKWAGMVFHPYAAQELPALAPDGRVHILESDGGFTVAIEKAKGDSHADP